MVLNNLLHLVSLLLTCSWRNRKRAVGISVLIIRPSHLLKKLLPAAVKQSQTSLCSSSSIEQLQLSSKETYTLWTCALSPPCLHPTAQLPNNGDCVWLRLSSEQTSEAGLQQITIAGPNDSSLSLCVSLHFAGLVFAELAGLVESSELSASHQCPVWKHARCVCVILQNDHYY